MSLLLRSAPGRRLFVAVGLVVAALSGCASSTTLVNMWRDPDYSRPMRSVLVLGMQRNQAVRRNWEDQMTAELSSRGIHATPSYQLFQNDLPDTAQIITGVRQEGFDGVLMVRPLGVETETHYVPGYTRSIPALGYDPWYGTYYNYYRHIYEPGYVETEQVVRHEVDLYSTGERGRLVWTGTTESVDPASRDEVHRKVATKVVAELVSSGVVAKG